MKSSPQGTIFHSSDYLTICDELLDGKLTIFGCFKGDDLIGGCALTVHNRIFKTATKFKMTPYGGVILKPSLSEKIHTKEGEYTNIIELFLEAFNDEHYRSITLFNSPSLEDIRPFTRNGWKSSVYYTYYLDLTDDLVQKMSRNVRKNIRKAIKIYGKP